MTNCNHKLVTVVTMPFTICSTFEVETKSKYLQHHYYKDLGTSEVE